MGGDRIGKLLHQRGEFLDLGGERLRCLQRAIQNVLDLGVHGIETHTEFGQLAREIAGTSRQRRYLRTRFGAIAQPCGNGVVNRQRRQDAERHQGGFRPGKTETQINHDAKRNGDEHHAGGDENRADAHHAEPRYASPRAVSAARFADRILSSVARPVSIRAATLDSAALRTAIVAKAVACFYKTAGGRR